MYSVAILGTGISAHLMARLCHRSGFDDVSLTTSDGQEPDQLLAENGPHNDLDTLAASQTRVLFALGLGEALMDHACLPDREQVRLAASGYLLSELPLGKFYQDRYGAPMLNIHRTDLAASIDSGVSADHIDPDTAGLTINTLPADLSTETRWRLAYARAERGKTAANTTWLARRGVVWQVPSRQHDHFYALLPQDYEWRDSDWHGSLREIVRQSLPVPAGILTSAVREHWQEGSFVHIAQACYLPGMLVRECRWCGFEDAWVLSRMMENYEEDSHAGVSEYVRYRKPRVSKIRRLSDERMQSYLATKRTSIRNLGIAFRTRFLPEMAMQRIDWLHQYDCIKGFN